LTVAAVGSEKLRQAPNPPDFETRKNAFLARTTVGILILPRIILLPIQLPRMYGFRAQTTVEAILWILSIRKISKRILLRLLPMRNRRRLPLTDLVDPLFNRAARVLENYDFLAGTC
jgi:hypothetical protein